MFAAPMILPKGPPPAKKRGGKAKAPLPAKTLRSVAARRRARAAPRP